MFFKFDKRFLAVSVLACCSAIAYGQVPTGTAGQLKHNMSLEELIHDARFEKAEQLFNAGNEAFLNEDFEAAITNYMRARKAYEAIGQSEFLDGKVASAKKQIAESYRKWAAMLAVDAEAKSNAEQYNEAIKLVRRAAEMDPEIAKKMKEREERYLYEQKAVERRNEVTDEKVVPDQPAIDEQVERLLAQARNLYGNRKFLEAKAKFYEVIRIQNNNVRALRGVAACNRKLIEIGNERSRTDTLKAMALAQNTLSLPIRESGALHDYAQNVVTPITKTVTVSSDLTGRLRNIRIPEISLAGEHLPEAIQAVMDEARANDPSGDGVNIILIWPSNVTVNLMGIPQQGPEINPFATMGNDFNIGGMNSMPTGAGGMPSMPMGNMPGNIPMGNMPMGSMPMGAMPMAADGTFGGMGGGMGGGMPMMPDMMSSDPAVELSEEDLKYPKIALNLSNVTVEDVIIRICRQAQLRYKIDSNAVIIAPQFVDIGDMEIRMFPLKREALLATDFSDPFRLMLFFASHGILFPNGSTIVYDPRSSRLIAKNSAENLDKLEELIQTRLNVKDVLVRIQAKFVEVSQNDLKELGFSYTLSNQPQTSNGKLEFLPNDNIMRRPQAAMYNDGLFTFQRVFQDYNFSASVYALDWTDSSDVMTAPRVTTLNGETAVIRMINRIYFPDDWEDPQIATSSSSSDRGPAKTTYTYISPVPNFDGEPRELGIQLIVKPEADVNRRTITMRITPVIRRFVGWSTYEYALEGTAFPPDINGNPFMVIMRSAITATRVIDTRVTCRDGETVILGGVLEDSVQIIDDKIPVLGDLPLIGRFFQSKGETSTKKNVLIFLTCSMVNPDGSPFFPEYVRPNGLPLITEQI